MNRFLKTIWPLVCLLAFFVGVILYGIWAYQTGNLLLFAVGVILGLILAPVVHECGHVLAAYFVQMGCVYCKIFCLQAKRNGDKLTWSFVSPFAEDQTQVIPKNGGNMKRRAICYTLGGLWASGITLLILLILVIFPWSARWLFLGMVFYIAYLFLMNVLPIAYSAGKTDMLIYKGLKTGADIEKTMLAAMEIQGRLYEGKRFSEIDSQLYNTPPLCEDEPLFLMMLDLQYRYALDCGDMESAAMRMNRLASLQDYLGQEELLSVAAELVYMHSKTGDLESAKTNLEVCKDFLERETATSKRICTAYYFACGATEPAEIIRREGLALCDKERVKGLALFEKHLLQNELGE